MLVRTYLRTFLNDIFKDNFLIKSLRRIVNFYCKLWFKNHDSIKFPQNLPISTVESKRVFSFQSVTGDKIDCK